MAQTRPTDFSGTWYIANDAGYSSGNVDNYYLVPARDPKQEHYADAYFHNQYSNDDQGTGDYTGNNYGDPEKPFLTTHKNDATAEPENLIWRFEPTGDGYYYIIHALTGKYLVYEYPYKKAKQRKSVHLQTLASPGANAKFDITGSSSGINIRPISLTGNNTNRFLNPANNNSDVYYGTSISGNDYFHVGMIGVWKDATGNSIWHYEEGALVKPAIVPNASAKQVNIRALQTGVTVYYTLDGTTPTSSSSSVAYPGGLVNIGNYRKTVKAIAYKNGTYSGVVTLDVDFRDVVPITALSQITNPDGKYQLTADIADASGHTTITNFTGEFDGNFHTINGLTQPLFGTVDNGTVRNIVLKDVEIVNHSGNTGAIACEIDGGTIVYNCGILSGSVGGTGDTGGLVGLLNTTSAQTIPAGFKPTRVINCYSFANITAAGTYAAGIVGNNNYGSNSQLNSGIYNKLRTAVINCMFYGDVLAGTNKAPVYGNKRLDNDANGINNYNYFLETATLDDGFTALSQYNCSWPVEERYLTRFEYFRSILNSNRRLCTWWITQKLYDDQTDDDLNLMAKWVLDPSIAPYPILKPWNKYYSVINQDPNQVWDEGTQTWVNRQNALPSQGKKLGTLTVTVDAGYHNSHATRSITLPVLDMDTLHNDFGYAKVQLPYYIDQFGDPTSNIHALRYGGNYTDSIVTGWKVTAVTGGTPGNFVENWESGYNFADRYCTNKDLYGVSHRVFAQGGWYYVPQDVTAITIEAYWGKAVYVRNTTHNIDRVKLGDSPFAPAGVFPSSFHGETVYTSIKNAILALSLEGSGATAKTVYDQAIVLVGNLQFKNGATIDNMGWANGNGNEEFATHNRPFTLTTVDLDFDNEPDYCFEWQFCKGTTRLNLHPIRFDFLPVPTLGMAIRSDNNQDEMAIGVFAPRGHFEITETSFMHTGQFEYDTRNNYRKEEAPLILNGGQFEQFVSSHNWNGSLGPINRTKYIILGGNVWMKEFTPGKHGNASAATRHCAVSVMGGDFERFCLSGVFISNNQISNDPDNPHCYTNGGRFGTMSGAGMENIDGDVTFKIDHSVIGEFYGGGLNAARPVSGSINVTINNSVVGKYCGGPKTGDMLVGTSVTTMANNTVFGEFYGGGDGGTNFNRNRLWDYAQATLADISDDNWKTLGGFNDFTPLQFVSLEAGYQAQFEFELIDISSGFAASSECAVMRTYRHEAQFTATEVRTVTSTLNNCTVLQDFYGGGNLGKVTGNVTSTLNGTTVYGSAYGGGNSSDVPMFSIHDKNSVVFPTRDLAGVNHPGSLDYVRDNGEIRYYHWIHDLSGVSVTPTPTHSNPAFQVDGQWYCYTDKDMTDLGSVGGNTILNVNGATKIYGTREVVSGGNSQTFYDGAAFGGGNESPVFGNSTVIVNGSEGLLVSNVYGGGNIATTGRPDTGGDSHVEIHNGTIGVVNTATGLHYDNSGSVYGGGKGELEDMDEGRVYGNASVAISGGSILNNVYAGGQLASVGYVNASGVMVNGNASVVISGGEVGPLDMTGLNAYVYGGGQGVETDPTNVYKDYANVNRAYVNVSGGRIWGSIFGGGADGHVIGDAEIHFTGGTIGTNGTTSWDGNIFGGGRNFRHTNRTAGRVGGNISIQMTGGSMKGNIYGGGRLGNTGVDIDGIMQEDVGNNTYGHITVDVSGGQIGYDHGFGMDVFEPTRYIDTIGCVYGGGKGITYTQTGNQINYITNWKDFAIVKTTDVNIHGNAYLWGNVYGGSEQSHVRDSVNVTIQENATVRLRAFAGGRGFLLGDDHRFKHAGDVGEEAQGNTPRHGLSRITLKDNAKVQVCLYGGGKVANVHGNAYVTLNGGQVGRKRTLAQIKAQPTHCYVFGSGQGNPANGEFNEWTNVDTAFVTIRPGTRVFGSVFGGGEDGHVLEDIFLDIQLGPNDSIGTHGYSKVDGNIFSGGRGFNPQALTAGGTRGNIHTHIHTAPAIINGDARPVILGSVFGGGRIASTGIQLVAGTGAGDTIPDTPTRRHGYTDVLLEGSIIIGHDYHQEELNGVMQSFKIGDIGGNVYGGAMGDDVAPNTVAGQMSHVKQTEVIVRGNAWVKGSVNGGGESGHVWKNTRVIIAENATIGVDRGNPEHPLTQPELDSLLYSGNVFGGSWGSDALLYVNQGRIYGNTTVLIQGGHIRNNIYGGGEYASVGTYVTLTDIHGNDSVVPRGGHTTVIMNGGELGPLDMSGWNAYVFGGGKGVTKDFAHVYKVWGDVFDTHVIIRDSIASNGSIVRPRVWGSIFGGAEDGHVIGDVLIDMQGGILGTTGITTWDGNIFGGGRNYSAANLSAGRVGGNITIRMIGGNAYGSVFGGGRLASVGVDANGVQYTESPDDHGNTFVYINGGTIGFHDENSANDMVRGNVYGGCKGIVRKPFTQSVEPALLANVLNTLVYVYDSINSNDELISSPNIQGSVYGGAEDGHVLSNTDVIISGGTIGESESACVNRYHGCVFGGGRGLGTNEHGEYSNTAGTVSGNALVTITGGHINRNVYGGGFLASVGRRGANFGDPDPNTGWARVKISGGTIGTDENEDIEHGNVFGSCRGMAGVAYQNFSYVNNALVTLTTQRIDENTIISPVVKGSVFGSGEDGHVLINTQVTINGGEVGVDGVDNPYKGNVYGGGRGIDLDVSGNLSPTAGLVRGNTKVSVQNGVVFGDVFGGGNASSVGGDRLVDILSVSQDIFTSPTIHGNVYGGSRAVPNSIANAASNLGLKTVNVRGGHIMGNVYGNSYSSMDGNPAHETDWTSFINIDGGLIDGNVHGAGWASVVRGSVCVNIGHNAIAYENASHIIVPRNADNFRFDDNGGLSIVVFGHVRNIDTDAGTATFTGFLVDEGVPRGSVATERGFCWHTSPHPTIQNSNAHVSDFLVGNYSMSVTGLVSGTTYYVRAYAKNARGEIAYSPEVQFTMVANGSSSLAPTQPTNDYRPLYTPTAKKLNILGSVYGGSDYYVTQGPHMNDWVNYFDVSGYSNVYIDGSDYNTTTTNTSESTYMNIGGGLFGCSTHCESGREGRNILLRNYGTRTETGNQQMHSSSRTFTTIQRCDNLLLDNANINIIGSSDINVSGGNTGQYAVLKVDSVLYLANASSLRLSHETTTPSHMDSIHCLRSVHLQSGTVYDQQIFNKLPWEWIGISGATAQTAKMYYTTTAPSTPLSYDQENVILFDHESRLWVRYHNHLATQYGELQGFIRMISPFEPYGMESFAYARPKITSGNPENQVDGGFLSYEPDKNFFTDLGATFTNTIQYPYTNVLQLGGSKNDRVDYREWLIPRMNGHRWYVDGTIGWGRDQTKTDGWGLSPDMPKKTIFGAPVAGNPERKGGIVTEVLSGTEAIYNYCFKKDIIFIVGALSASDEAAILYDSLEYPLKLYRYPGGHPLSWATSKPNDFHYDLGGGTPASPNTGLDFNSGDPDRYKGPGAYYGPLMVMDNNSQNHTFDGVMMDGLYGHQLDEDILLMIPGPGWQPTAPAGGWVTAPSAGTTIPTFVQTSITAPSVEVIAGTLTLQGNTVLRRGFNNHDAIANLGTAAAPKYNYYLNPDFDNSVINGGALYVGQNATVNVNGLVTITENYQKKGATAIKSNVYLSTFTTHLHITAALDEATRIGITSPNRNNETSHAPYDYRYNTFSPVAVATNTADALYAWQKSIFSDDLNWFFVNGHSNSTPRTTYYATSITDYPATGFTPANTLFFGWTWNNVVRMQPDGYSPDKIDSAHDLAWIISLVNGLNGQRASNLSSTDLIQTDDIDLEQYVWLPIGSNTTGAVAFSGSYDGQGHLIENLSIDYIGSGDRLYERTYYGLFGDINNGVVDRTFAVSGLIRPVGVGTLGGLVGYMEGANARVSNSESAVTLYCPNTYSNAVAAGGLVGIVMDGEIFSSMAMNDIHATNYHVIGGLVGYTGSIDGSGDNTVFPRVNNSFANMKLTLGSSNHIVAIGGLVGINRKAAVSNCYVQLQPGSTTPSSSNFGVLVGDNQTTVTHCAGFGKYNNQTYALTRHPGSGDDPYLTNSYRYTPVMDADILGYMYYDNLVTIGKQSLALFKWLNDWVSRHNSSSNDYQYSYWSRPATPVINSDLPVLHLCNGATALEGNGDFRSLATYNKGVALQYGGEVRDGDGTDDDGQLSTMLGRNEYIFVYGDVIEDLSLATIRAEKVSIYEHAAILHPGRLSSFGNTYVGITFDNSNSSAQSSPGVNFGLGGIGMGPYPLPRDWHMFSSPLSDAPLGFDYKTHNEAGLYTGGDYSNSNYFNNPWTDLSTEFSWLQSNGSDNVRYWMYGWTNSQSQSDPLATLNTTDWRDGYFPSQVGAGRAFGLGCIEGTDEYGRYPYGMDLYTWNEPQYHWINFKRNGPNHWHTDETNDHHDHLDYEPYDGATRNVNETSLIVGRGYMAAICDTTFMQSHGQLNAGRKTIALTKTGTSKLPGWNLIGNPYHAYLDFEEFLAENGSALGVNDNHYFYVVYDADGYREGIPQSAFLYYPSQGSEGGAYAGRYLHPHQGFYVLANADGLDATFTEDMLVTRTTLGHGTENDGHFRGDDDRPAYPLVNLFLSSENGCHDITVIEFERPEWGGARKMKELRMGNGVFYAQHNNTHYAALFAKRGTERVPLWFEAKEDDTFTINWNTANGDFHSMWLVDNLTGVRYDMIENDSYIFQGHVGDYPSRFYITFNVTDLEEHDDDDDNFVFFDGSEWVVTGDGMLDFIDMSGNVLWSNRLSGGQSRVGLPHVACGVYLMRLTNSEGIKVQKIIVMR